MVFKLNEIPTAMFYLKLYCHSFGGRLLYGVKSETNTIPNETNILNEKKSYKLNDPESNKRIQFI